MGSVAQPGQDSTTPASSDHAFDLGFEAGQHDAAERAANAALALAATPCPPWCNADHEDGDRFHYGEPVYVAGGLGDIALTPDILEDGSRALTIRAHGDDNRLTLPEVDELIEKLTELRGVLTGSAA
jgi:hypothetical protein